jgi:hypothetical protein
MRRALSGLSMVVIGLGATIAPHAQAQASDGVTLRTGVTIKPDPPFDRWCLGMRCAAPGSKGPLFAPPAFIAPASTDGLLEAKAKSALVHALDAAAKAALGDTYNEAVADLATAIAATASGSQDHLQQVGGLGAASLRAGLTYELETILAAEPTCEGPRRFDAIYEGLAISVALMPLDFPQRRGIVAPGCEGTAHGAARAVDGAILRALIDAAKLAALQGALRSVEDVRRKCGGAPADASEDTRQRARAALDALNAGTVSALASALRRLSSSAPSPSTPAAPSTPPATSATDAACASAFDGLRTLDPIPLEGLAAAGLGDASLPALASVASETTDPSMQLWVRIATGGLTREDMNALVTGLAHRAGLPVDTPVLSGVVGILDRAIVVRDGSITIDPNLVLAYLRETYDADDEGKVALRSLVGLQPSPWIVELNGGVPNVDFTQQKVVADLSFGYSTKALGVVGRGWIDTYDIDSSGTHSDYTHAGGSVEGWWLSGEPTAPWRLELRLSGEFDYYDTTTYPLVNALDNFYDFDSRIGRGNALVGVRYGRPSDRVTANLLVGGGGQYEDPDTTTFNGVNTLVLQSDDNFSGDVTGRLAARWRIVPAIFGARVRAESTYFSITREQLTVASKASGSLGTTASVEQEQQLEVHARLFLDADIASLSGFVPAVFGGLDYLNIQGSATGTSTVIPSLGIGIVRQSP